MEGKKDLPRRPKTAEKKYKVKGEKTEEDAKEEGGNTGKSKDGDKKQEPEEKNYVYQNPTTFKETRKFKYKSAEFRDGDWRKSKKVFVTLETEIPPMPEKLLTKPDETKFRKEVGELNEKIKETVKKLDDRKADFDETLSKKNSTL